jgi:hypothetical protein
MKRRLSEKVLEILPFEGGGREEKGSVVVWSMVQGGV